jgi:hypothetical protein
LTKLHPPTEDQHDDTPTPGDLIPLTTKGLVVQPFFTLAGLRRMDVQVPALDSFDKSFVFRPKSFVAEKAFTREGEPLLIPDTTQRLGLYRFIRSPLAPCTYGVSSDFADAGEHFVLFLSTYWLHHWGNDVSPCRLLWLTAEDSFKDVHAQMRSGKLTGFKCVVVTGLRPDIPSEELWYLNGILSRFRDRPRILSITGTDAYSFMKTRLGYKPTAVTHLTEPRWELTKKMQRAEKAAFKGTKHGEI